MSPAKDQAGEARAEDEAPDADGSLAGNSQGRPPSLEDETRRLLAVTWTFRQALWGLCLTVLPLIILFSMAQLATGGPGAAQGNAAQPLTHAQDVSLAISTLITSTLVEALFLIAPLYYAIRRRPPDTSAWAGVHALGLRGFSLGRALVLFAGGIVVVYAFSALYDQLHVQTNADALAQQATRAPLTTMATLLVAVVVAPVCEEIFFRGYVFPAFAQKMPIWGAVIVTALIFGAAHADVGSFVPLVVIGMVLAVLRWQSGSLWPGMIFHALNNGAAAILILSVLH